VCDRVAANGDTANKVGTLQVAVVARHFSVAFYVAAPSSSVDLGISTGREIVIEQRPASEMTSIAGVPITASGLFIVHSLVRRFLGLIQARRQKMKWRGCFLVKKVDLFSTQGALCTVSVFSILHFTCLGRGCVRA